MKVRLLLAFACSFGTIMVSATPALAVEPVVLVNTDRPELGPVASTSFLAWFVFSPRFHASVRAQATGSDTSFRVNPQGTNAFTGGIDGSTLIYEIQFPGEKDDVAMVDLATQTELDVPDGINTKGHEYSPGISGTHILFGRGFRRARMVVFDTATSESEVVYTRSETERRFFQVLPTQVNGNYAVWQQAVFSKRTNEVIDSDVFLYDIAAGTTTKLPETDPERPSQYGPSVDAEGTLYYGRSSFACGENAELVRRDLDGTESVVYAFPTGRDFSFSFALDNASGTNDVFFDGTRCRGSDFGDIWKLPGV
jgi:hypothetical protein